MTVEFVTCKELFEKCDREFEEACASRDKSHFEQEREKEYRRGLRDGWVHAIDTLHDLMFEAGLSRQVAYSVCWDWCEGALYEWARGVEGWGFKPPPLPPERFGMVARACQQGRAVTLGGGKGE